MERSAAASQHAVASPDTDETNTSQTANASSYDTEENALNLITNAVERMAHGKPVTFPNNVADNPPAVKKIWAALSRLQKRLRETTCVHANAENGQFINAASANCEKAEAIRTLADGIACDFSSIFGTIIGYTEVALLESDEQGVHSPELTEVLRVASRGGDLVKHLLAFSKQDDAPDSRPVKLNKVLAESIGTITHALPANISFETQIPSEPCLAVVDAAQFHQAVVNLCTNAMQSMESADGTLSITLTNTSIRKTKAAELGIATGSYAALSVKDTGIGMDKSIAARVFEPYFTTRKRGNGTGMGLAVVSAFVRNQRGAIELKTEPNAGSTFTIFLPSVLRIRRRTTMKVPLPTGKETILFVDDEVPLVNFGQRLLTRLGYRVFARTSSVEALEAFRNHLNEIDLIVTDQMMPNMTGIELARKLRELKPNVPIILATGYSEDQALDQRANAIGITFLANKPYLSADLARMVRNAIDGRPNKAR